MKGTPINNKALFDTWCDMVTSDILSTSIVSKDAVTTALKVSIVDNIELLIECFVDRLDWQIMQTVKLAQSQIGTDKYLETGYKIRLLKEKKRALQKKKNEEHQKRRNENRYKRLKNYLLSEEDSNIMDRYYAYKDRQLKENK